MFQRAAEQINAGEFLENFRLFLLRQHVFYVKMLDSIRQEGLWTRFHSRILPESCPHRSIVTFLCTLNIAAIFSFFSEMKRISVFKNYEAGEPTCRLYVKNIAKQVEEKVGALVA